VLLGEFLHLNRDITVYGRNGLFLASLHFKGVVYHKVF